MTALVTPFTEILSTDVYTLDITYTGAGYGGLPPPTTGMRFTPIYPGFSWMGISEALWLPGEDPRYWMAQYYNRWQYSITVNVLRVCTVGNGGLTVVDNQVSTEIVMVVSDTNLAGEPISDYPDVGVANAYGEAHALGYTTVPSSLTFTYNNASWNTVTGTTNGIPQGPAVLDVYSSFYQVNSQSPKVLIDQFDTFNAGAITLNKLIGNALFPAINQGGIFDPQTTSNADEIIAMGGSIVQLTGPTTLINYYAGVSETTFGLLLDRANVPLGTLVCKSVNQTVFPALPRLQLKQPLSGTIFVSALANVTGWGGFRYLDFTARLAGFDATQPLPRIMIGLVPTSQVSQATCAAALLGTPTFGNWYEIEVTEQITTGQEIEIDTCCPIQGSGTWCAQNSPGPFVAGNAYAMPDPLGVGIWTNNPCLPAPGGTAGSLDSDTTPGVLTFDTATLVLAVDTNTVKQSSANANTYIDLSNFRFTEKTGSVLTIDINALDNSPVSPVGQPSNIEVSSPSDGSLITVYRDGKPSASVRWLLAGRDGHGGSINPMPFLAFDYSVDDPTGVDWSTIFNALNALNNGYTWTFEPLYSNFMAGTEYPPSFLPVPSKFAPVSFKLGSTANIPVAARCVAYTNTAPWAFPQQSSIISGDDPVKVDNCNSHVLCLSDYMGSFNFPVTVQSARIGPGAVVAIANNAAPYGPPVATSDFGPVSLMPDANGMITINAGSPTSWGLDTVTENATGYEGYTGITTPMTVTFSQNELTPQIDGFLITFDEGLAKGQAMASGDLFTVYVPVRNGQESPITYTPTSSSGLAEEDISLYFQPSLMRGGAGAFCLRKFSGGVTKYSEPRHAFWKLSTDNMGRIVATLKAAFVPYPVQMVRYPTRSGSYVQGFYPHLDIYEAQMVAVYRRLDNIWVRAFTNDQFTTLGDETVLFNQSGGTMVTCEYDQSTGSQFYVMSLRNDGLSWQPAPTATTNPGFLPQVIVIRRHDAQGNSLAFTKTPTAAVAGTVWENILFTNQPTGGVATVQLDPVGKITLVAGNEEYTSTDNGSNFYDSTGTLVPSITNMTAGSLPGGATGGTQIA